MKTYDIIIMTEGSDPAFNVVRAAGAYKIASFLRNQGYSVFVLNNFSYFMRKGNLNEILDKLIGDNTLWVGFSSTLFMRKRRDIERYRHTRDIARQNVLWRWPISDEEIKDITDYIRAKGVKTVYGGMMTYHRAAEVRECIDYYVVGMGEHPALHITEHLKNGTELRYNPAYGKYPYVIDYDQKGALFDFRNERINYVPEDFWSPEDGMGIEFGRGCIFKCKFCAYPLIGKRKGDNSFLREKECIKAELKQNYDLYGTTKYVIIDDTFNEQTVKLQTIAEAIEELNLPEKLQFGAFIRIDLVAAFPEQIELLKRINVRAWFLGVESLNYESAKSISKGCTKEKIFETIEKSKEAFDGSLSIFASFIAGLPYDTRETMDQWTKEVFERRDLFDAFAFSPLELGTASELSRNPEKFGYTINKQSNMENKWSNEHWTSDEVVDYVYDLQQEHARPDEQRVSTFFLIYYQCLGFSFDELRKITYKEIFGNLAVHRRARHHLYKNYYSKVENFLGIKPAEPDIRYVKNLSISKNLKDTLLKEYDKHKHKSKLVESLQVISGDDIEDCDFANKLAQKISAIIGCNVFPHYHHQYAGSYVEPPLDQGILTSINIILKGSSPITWNDWTDIYYECALLNVQENHCVQSEDDRILLKFDILDKDYNEVLELIEGKEDKLFDIKI